MIGVLLIAVYLTGGAGAPAASGGCCPSSRWSGSRYDGVLLYEFSTPRRFCRVCLDSGGSWMPEAFVSRRSLTICTAAPRTSATCRRRGCPSGAAARIRRYHLATTFHLDLSSGRSNPPRARDVLIFPASGRWIRSCCRIWPLRGSLFFSTVCCLAMSSVGMN